MPSVSQYHQADYWINHLELTAHPEGGFFREVYRSDEEIRAEHLPGRFNGPRSFGTSIYFLLRNEDRSRLHRIKSDEIWHFYRGLPLIIQMFSENGSGTTVRLGSHPGRDEHHQFTVTAGTWFGVTVDHDSEIPENFALAGCTVAPGFDFHDFEMADDNILNQFPEHRDALRHLL